MCHIGFCCSARLLVQSSSHPSSVMGAVRSATMLLSHRKRDFESIRPHQIIFLLRSYFLHRFYTISGGNLDVNRVDCLRSTYQPHVGGVRLRGGSHTDHRMIAGLLTWAILVAFLLFISLDLERSYAMLRWTQWLISLPRDSLESRKAENWTTSMNSAFACQRAAIQRRL